MSSTSSTSSSSGSSATTASALGGYLNNSSTLAALSGLTGSNQPQFTLSGLGSGINDSQIVAELMQVAEQPVTQLKAEVTDKTTQLTAYQALQTDATALQTVADSLTQPSNWQLWSASSSSSEVTATAGSGSVGGSLTFSVNQLASAELQVSSGTVANETTSITNGSILVAAGGGAIGLGTVQANLALGSHTIAVTQASAAATQAAGSALASSTTISSTNNTLTYQLANGTSQTLTLAAGTYTPAALASALGAASNGQLAATVGNSGTLEVSTTAQGSANALTLTGGTALTTLGFSGPTATATGTDGVVTVDGVSTTVTNAYAGAQVTLNGPGGNTVNATLSGGLVAGSINAAEVGTGDGSLTDVIQGINGANAGVTAAAIQTGTDQYRLQLQSNSTGADNTINIDPSVFAGMGTMNTVVQASDAQLQVGSGASAFTVSSSSNTVTGLMPGVTLNLQSASPGTPVTVNLSPDSVSAATNVTNLVAAANQLIKDLNTDTAFTPNATDTTKAGTAGPLLGDPTAETLIDSVLSAVATGTGANGLTAAKLGISMNTDGTVNFNATTFEATYSANPQGVANSFVQGGTSSNPSMSFYLSTDATQAGNYDVQVTQAATQATDTGSVVTGGAVSTPETLTINSGPHTASYTTTSGESLQDVASGLNQAFATSNIAVNATVQNGALVMQSLAYGSGASFSVSSNATGTGTTGLGTGQTYTGTDVAGTIGGVAATGTGQLLLGAAKTGQQGLLIHVSATPSELQADGGTLTGTMSYTPGLAQALAAAAFAAVNPSTGSLTNAVSGMQTAINNLQTDITNWNPVLQEKQLQLEQEYTSMETSVSSLKSTQQSLAQDVASMTGTSSSSKSGG